MLCWACQALAQGHLLPLLTPVPTESQTAAPALPTSCPAPDLTCCSAPACCASHQALVSTHAQPLHLPLQIYLLFRARLAPPFTFAAREPESLEAALFRPEDIPWDSLAFSSVSIALKQ